MRFQCFLFSVMSCLLFVVLFTFYLCVFLSIEFVFIIFLWFLVLLRSCCGLFSILKI